MALVKPDSARLAKIKVIGVGGGGMNSVRHMIEENKIAGVEFIAVNTDAQVLLDSPTDTKLQIGEKLTRGLGVGGDPALGRKAATESSEKIKELLIDTDMVFITAGMGGGTGTGAAPLIAQTARQAGALTVAIVTKPFAFEGTRRMVVAEDGIEELTGQVDALIVIPNQRLMDVIDRKVTLVEAFKVADSVLAQGVQGISEIITNPGLINVDFADVRMIMKDAGSALLGIGTGVGESRSQMAARAAISSPLLEISIEGAKGVLFNISGGPDMTMTEVDEAAKIISETADADANIIFGATVDDGLSDQIRVTVIATGFDEMRSRLSRMVAKDEEISEPEGVVSELPEVKEPKNVSSDDNDEGVEEEVGVEKEEGEVDREDKKKSKKNGKDEWGEEYEIPAFLRQGR